MEIDPHNERDRTATRGIEALDQDPDRAAVCGNRRHVVLGFADFRSDHDAKGGRLEESRRQAFRPDH